VEGDGREWQQVNKIMPVPLGMAQALPCYPQPVAWILEVTLDPGCIHLDRPNSMLPAALKATAHSNDLILMTNSHLVS
jgi:hypothetical protein